MERDAGVVGISLSTAFAGKSNPAVRVLIDSEPEAEGLLREAVRAARAAHPSLVVDEGEFAAFLGEHALEGNSLADTLAQLHTADLLLTFACLRRYPGAMEAFRQLVLGEVTRAARRIGASDALRDEVQQSLTASFVAEHGLARYSGRGGLAGFVRVAAMRNLMRSKSRENRSSPLSEAELPDTVAQLRDPEIEVIKVRYRHDFNDAFRIALDALSHRERAVLRLHLLGSMNIDGIASCYRVHRATVARWMAEARKKLLDQTEQVLMQRLSISPAEVHSLARLLRSQLDPGLTTILRNSEGNVR